jgi:hypothetical protein
MFYIKHDPVMSVAFHACRARPTRRSRTLLCLVDKFPSWSPPRAAETGPSASSVATTKSKTCVWGQDNPTLSFLRD